METVNPPPATASQDAPSEPTHESVALALSYYTSKRDGELNNHERVLIGVLQAHLRASPAPASAALREALEAGARALTGNGQSRPDYYHDPIAAENERHAATLRRHAEGVKT